MTAGGATVTLTPRTDDDGSRIIDGHCTGCGSSPTWCAWRDCGHAAFLEHADAARAWATGHAQTCTR